MSLSRPGASITLNGQRLGAAEAGLAAVRLDLGLNSHDSARLLLWPDSTLANAEAGMSLQIGLESAAGGLSVPTAGLAGGGTGTAVWSGAVEAVETGAAALVLHGLADTAELSRTRRSATWADQSVADIVHDLAGSLAREVDADLDLPNFSIDKRRPVWAHLRDLARLAGAELSCAAAGGLRFLLADRDSAAIELHYGAEIIDWQLSRARVPTPVGVVAGSAASSVGVDKWHWLAHDPAGSDGEEVIAPASLRTRAAAEGYSQALEARAQRAALRGTVWVVGRTDLRPGARMELKDLPGGDSAPLRVRAVTHQLDGENGFITALAVQGAGS